MVQVDIFWSYGLGAGLAVAASEQLRREGLRSGHPTSTHDEDEAPDALASPYFSRAMLYIACLFAPSGVCLLWEFPSWETMHAGDASLPGWLVTLFAVTNVTQGALGYLVARRAIRRGRHLRAAMHWVAAYFGMFFILVHGWDGEGYRRFFSATRADYEAWHAGRPLEFLSSDVAMTLYAMGLVLLPVLFGMSARWIRRGYEIAELPPPSALGSVLRVLVLVFGLGLGGAIATAFAVWSFGWWPGFFAGAAGTFALARFIVVPRVGRRMMPAA